ELLIQLELEVRPSLVEDTCGLAKPRLVDVGEWGQVVDEVIAVHVVKTRGVALFPGSLLALFPAGPQLVVRDRPVGLSHRGPPVPGTSAKSLARPRYQ